MKPQATTVLAVLSELISREVGPALGDTYLNEQLQRSAALLGAIDEEFDRAADRRVRENRALRALFMRAAPQLADSDAALAALLADAGREDDLDDLRVSRLDAVNQGLRALLIRLHAWAEAHAAQDLLTEIWAELRESTERRALAMGRR